jgi:hypothetical protein
LRAHELVWVLFDVGDLGFEFDNPGRQFRNLGLGLVPGGTSRSTEQQRNEYTGKSFGGVHSDSLANNPTARIWTPVRIYTEGSDVTPPPPSG